MKRCIILLVLLYIGILTIPFAIGRSEEDSDNKYPDFTGLSVQKQSLAIEHRRIGMHDGNLVRSSFSNYGYFGLRNSLNFICGEWPKDIGMNYIGESTFYVGAEVTDSFGLPRHIITDSYSGGSRDKAPDDSHTYSWEPLNGYFNEDQSNVNDFPAMSHLPETWPASWLNAPDEWSGKWNGEFGPFPIADQESYYVMDDRNNDEFGYYPFIGSRKDSLPFPTGRRGLGIEVAVRGYQWADPRLEDVWFTVYDITNVSDKDLEKLVCGFYNDWDFGSSGVTGERDELFAFDVENSLVYQWDLDGFDALKRPSGYIAQKIIQSPDNLGLTSYYGSGGEVLSDDEDSWLQRIKPGIFKPVPEGYGDIAFITGTGYFSLMRGETKRYAIALIWGWNEDEIYLNAKYAKWFYDGGYQFDVHTVSILSPAESDVLNGITEIRWSADGSDSLLIDIYYSIDDWQTWRLITENEENDGVFPWDTQSVEDGINYSIIVMVHDRSGMGQSLATGHFTVNNPLPAHPEVFIASPVGGNVITGIHNVRWRAGDADDDEVFLDLYYSQDNGQSWNLIASDLSNDGIYPWDTTPLPNGVNYMLKVVVSDGILEGTDIIDEPFQIENSHPLILPETVEHVSGAGDGKVGIHVIDETMLTGHSYELTFSASEDVKTYNVFDLDLEKFVLENIEVNNNMEGPIFDGVRLWIKDYLEAEPIDSLTGWKTSGVNLEINVEKYPGNTALPADFEIRILGFGADTSYSRVASTIRPVDFQVWNVTDSVKMQFTFYGSYPGDSTISAGDKIIIITNNKDWWRRASWIIIFEEPCTGQAILPDSGDVAFIAIAKPFSENDIFHFKTLKENIVSISPENSVVRTFSLAQNYPNPFNASTTLEYSIPKACRVSLKIYDILGREVTTLLNKIQQEGIHRIRWNGRNGSGHILPSGVYFYRISAGEYVEIKKAVLLQ